MLVAAVQGDSEGNTRIVTAGASQGAAWGVVGILAAELDLPHSLGALRLLAGSRQGLFQTRGVQPMTQCGDAAFVERAGGCEAGRVDAFEDLPNGRVATGEAGLALFASYRNACSSTTGTPSSTEE